MTCRVCRDQAACDGDGPPGCWHREQIHRANAPPKTLNEIQAEALCDLLDGGVSIDTARRIVGLFRPSGRL